MSDHCSFYDLQTYGKLKSPHKYFDIVKIVGTGTYGTVYLAIHKESMAKVAVKVVEFKEKSLLMVRDELEILRKYSSHLNIGRFFGAYLDRINTSKQKIDYLWVVMEYCNFGTTNDVIIYFAKQEKRLKESWCIYFLKGILTGLEYLHDKGIIHRDIKSQNIMLNKDGVIKIVDFGVSCILTSSNLESNEFIGTPYWMAPEIILCQNNPEMKYGTKSDIWSVGITAIEYSDGNFPRFELNPIQVLKVIPFSNPPKLKIKIGRSEGFRKIIKNCLIHDPSERLTATSLLNDKLFLSFIKNEPEVITDIISTLGRFQIPKSQVVANLMESYKNTNNVSKIIYNECGLLIKESTDKSEKPTMNYSKSVKSADTLKIKKHSRKLNYKEALDNGERGNSQTTPHLNKSTEITNSTFNEKYNVNDSIKEVKSLKMARKMSRVTERDPNEISPEYPMISDSLNAEQVDSFQTIIPENPKSFQIKTNELVADSSVKVKNDNLEKCSTKSKLSIDIKLVSEAYEILCGTNYKSKFVIFGSLNGLHAYRGLMIQPIGHFKKGTIFHKIHICCKTKLFLCIYDFSRTFGVFDTDFKYFGDLARLNKISTSTNLISTQILNGTCFNKPEFLHDKICICASNNESFLVFSSEIHTKHFCLISKIDASNISIIKIDLIISNDIFMILLLNKRSISTVSLHENSIRKLFMVNNDKTFSFSTIIDNKYICYGRNIAVYSEIDTNKNKIQVIKTTHLVQKNLFITDANKYLMADTDTIYLKSIKKLNEETEQESTCKNEFNVEEMNYVLNYHNQIFLSKNKSNNICVITYEND